MITALFIFLLTLVFHTIRDAITLSPLDDGADIITRCIILLAYAIFDTITR